MSAESEKVSSGMQRQTRASEWAEPDMPRVFNALQLQRPEARMLWNAAVDGFRAKRLDRVRAQCPSYVLGPI